MRFDEFKTVTESKIAGQKNLHLTHLEDLVFTQGKKGVQSAIEYVNGVREMLYQGHDTGNKLTVKWDGAPAIVAGVDPEDGKFFVGTKGVFSKSRKMIKAPSDLDKHGYEGELREKLQIALKYLGKLNIETVMQGDIMFVHDDLKTQNIDGTKCYVFQPNTIAYAVPVDSDIGKRIGRAHIGVIFHTEYTGRDIQDMEASFGVNVTGLSHTPDVWFDDASYKDISGKGTLTDAENAQIENALEATKQMMDKAKFDKVSGEYQKLFMQYVNARIKDNKPQIADPAEFAENFKVWFEQHQEKEIQKLKNQDADAPAVVKRRKAAQDAQKFVEKHFEGITAALAVYKDLIALKKLLLTKLNKIDQLQAMIKTKTGYKVTNQEGFVAVGSEGGAVKLVDRLEFSKQNFTATRNWK